VAISLVFRLSFAMITNIILVPILIPNRIENKELKNDFKNDFSVPYGGKVYKKYSEHLFLSSLGDEADVFGD